MPANAPQPAARPPVRRRRRARRGAPLAAALLVALAVAVPLARALTSSGHVTRVAVGKTARHTLATSAGARGLAVRARADGCAGSPRLAVRLDGGARHTVTINSARWRTYTLALSVPPGRHTLTLTALDARHGCAAVLVDRVTPLVAHAPSPATTSPNPLVGARFFVDPNSHATQQVRAWRTTRPADAAALQKLADHSQADWFGDWNTTVRQDVGARVGQITAAGALPVLVAYNIPHRDCGSYSSGGAASPRAYEQWINAFAEGIGARRAVVILEPDLLPELDCFSPAVQRSQLALLNYAVNALAAHHGVTTYIDAGNSGWQSPSVIAARLRAAGVARARGFSLNVSNFNSTADETAYAKRIAALLGPNTHFVIDTSRNARGSAPANQWCNPPGRGLGSPATAQTADPAVDAYLWIKAPGESDGNCNGGPASGAWWPDYALGLAQRAAF